MFCVLHRISQTDAIAFDYARSTIFGDVEFGLEMNKR